MKRTGLARKSSSSSGSLKTDSARDLLRSRYVLCVRNEEYPASLERLKLYRRVADAQSERHGLIRVIDESGEDYLYPANYFQPLDWAPDGESGHTALTIHLDPRTKAILRAEALAAHTSMGALVRQWIEERLELQSRREAAR